MISRITRVLFIFVVVGLALGVVFFNQEPVTVRYSRHDEISLMGGVVFLICFSLGLLSSLGIWIISGVKTYFRERSYRALEEKQQQFNQLFLEARSLQSAGEYSRAAELWQKLIKKDLTNIIARVELSKSLELAGDLKKALKVLDKARETDPTNVEVLLQAANLNEKLGNKTAALDNLALAIYQEPTAHATGSARDLSVELGRLEDALEYQEQYETVGGDTSSEESLALQYESIKQHFDAQLAQRDELAESDITALEKDRDRAIKKFIKSNPRFVTPVLENVEQLEAAGKTDDAAELLLLSAKENKSPVLWRKAIDLWLREDDGDKALSAARTALRNASRSKERYLARLDLARVNLLIGKPEDALSELEEISELDQADDDSLRRNYLALMGYSLNQIERFQDAAKVWKRLLESPGATGRTLLLPLDTSRNEEKAVYFPALKEVSGDNK